MATGYNLEAQDILLSMVGPAVEVQELVVVLLGRVDGRPLAVELLERARSGLLAVVDALEDAT